jgi:GNAT superfamily N-acetyltransferase
MPDLIVNLLSIPGYESEIVDPEGRIFTIRRAQPYESSQVRDFVSRNFSVAWADEVSVGFSHQPITVFLATEGGVIRGFSAYECTRKCFFGPTGVSEKFRGAGLGKALLLAALGSLAELGYVYGIIGGAGPVEFYRRIVGAQVIENSEPGIYVDILRQEI